MTLSNLTCSSIPPTTGFAMIWVRRGGFASTQRAGRVHECKEFVAKTSFCDVIDEDETGTPLLCPSNRWNRADPSRRFMRASLQIPCFNRQREGEAPAEPNLRAFRPFAARQVPRPPNPKTKAVRSRVQKMYRYLRRKHPDRASYSDNRIAGMIRALGTGGDWSQETIRKYMKPRK